MGICALSTGIYGKSGRVILFVGTIMVIAIIVFTLLRWIEHLSSFGRVGNTIDRVERVAKSAGKHSPFSIGIGQQESLPPRGQRSAHSTEIGYITHIDLNALEDVAHRLDCTIDVLVTPGSFVTPASVLACWDCGKGLSHTEIGEAFTIERHRQFDHDPRFGLVVLSEIASRALSPAVNDPGTAIAVLGAGVRVVAALLADTDEPKDRQSKRIRLPDLMLADLLEDIIQPIARDGAGLVEVAIMLQRSLGQIAALAPTARGVLARSAAAALVRCAETMTFTPDLDQVRATYNEYWANSAQGETDA